LTKEGPYGFSHEGPLFDQQLVLAIINIDFLAMMNFSSDFCDAAAECGLNSFIIMAGALHGMAVESELHSYEGPFGVGYATATFKPTKPDELRRFDQIYRMNQTELLSKIKAEEDSYVRLARQSLEFFIRSKKHLKRPDGLQDELINQKAGVFVSLKIEGRLRGCIGTIEPTSACIADEIIQNAVSSGTADPRFSPVSEIELDQIVYSVDVLKKSETVSTIDELDAKRYGVIVRYRGKSGLLLPNLEGVDTPQEQLEIALQKAGIDPSLPYSIERFEVIRHH
jgi:AmmeMemoRadiSam system protein A